jgi:hypothetical protein
MPKFCVPVIYSGLSNFIVEADNKEEAETKARELFRGGETPDMLGNEYENVESIGEIEQLKEGSKGLKNASLPSDQ